MKKFALYLGVLLSSGVLCAMEPVVATFEPLESAMREDGTADESLVDYLADLVDRDRLSTELISPRTRPFVDAKIAAIQRKRQNGMIIWATKQTQAEEARRTKHLAEHAAQIKEDKERIESNAKLLIRLEAYSKELEKAEEARKQQEDAKREAKHIGESKAHASPAPAAPEFVPTAEDIAAVKNEFEGPLTPAKVLTEAEKAEAAKVKTEGDKAKAEAANAKAEADKAEAKVKADKAIAFASWKAKQAEAKNKELVKELRPLIDEINKIDKKESAEAKVKKLAIKSEEDLKALQDSFESRLKDAEEMLKATQTAADLVIAAENEKVAAEKAKIEKLKADYADKNKEKTNYWAVLSKAASDKVKSFSKWF